MIKQDARGVPTIEGSAALVVFGFGLLAFVFLAPVGIWGHGNAALRAVYDDGEPMPIEFRILYGAYALVMTVCWAAAIPLVIAYFRRQSTVPRFVLAFIGVALAANVLVTLFENLLVRDRAFTVMNSAFLAIQAPVAIAWAAYFARSTRVKATFVYPLQDPAEDA
jgi:hypothetical protein